MCVRPRSNRRKHESEQGATSRRVTDCHVTAMRLHDLSHDWQAQPCPTGARTGAAPKALKDVRPVGWRHTAAVIADTDSAIVVHRHADLSGGRRMDHCVLDEVT